MLVVDRIGPDPAGDQVPIDAKVVVSGDGVERGGVLDLCAGVRGAALAVAGGLSDQVHGLVIRQSGLGDAVAVHVGIPKDARVEAWQRLDGDDVEVARVLPGLVPDGPGAGAVVETDWRAGDGLDEACALGDVLVPTRRKTWSCEYKVATGRYPVICDLHLGL